MKVWKQWMIAVAVMVAAPSAIAGPKTLIELNGGKPTAGLAKAWKKLKAGSYQFSLDPSKEIGKGTPVNAAAVKLALEAKLGATLGVAVADKGANVIEVRYTGDEAKFLAEVAKTKIRAGEEVAMTLDSATSEGSIRANPGNRYPKDGEVKGAVVSAQPTQLVVRINDSKAGGIKSGAKVKVKTDGSKFRPSQTVFFVPESQEGDVWVPKAGSVVDK